MGEKISGTKEWAATNENILFGCQHDCLYCYAKAMSVRHKKIDIKKWHEPFLRPGIKEKGIGKRTGTIMFPTTHDIHPDNIDDTIDFLYKLLTPGNDVLIVSKPHFSCIERMTREFFMFKKQILFRFTIGSARNEVLKYWEPNAPDFDERFLALRHAQVEGFKTSVSCEPMLDNPMAMVDLVDTIKPFVTDSIWLGKMNQLQRCKINGASGELFESRVAEIEGWQSDEKIKALYGTLKDYPVVKWKESIKKVVGLELPTEKGKDV